MAEVTSAAAQQADDVGKSPAQASGALEGNLADAPAVAAPAAAAMGADAALQASLAQLPGSAQLEPDDDALSFSYDGEEMEELEEEEEVEQVPLSLAGQVVESPQGASSAPLTVAALPESRRTFPPSGAERGQQQQQHQQQQQLTRQQRPDAQGGNFERHLGGVRMMGPSSSGRPAGLGAGPARGPGMMAFPQMLPGMMGGMPMSHGRPMSREEFQRLQSMGGMGAGMPGMTPLMFGADPAAMAAMLASQGMHMPYDPMSMMPAANGQGSGPGAMHMGGLGHSHRSQQALPPHLRSGGPRIGSAGSSGMHDASNGTGARSGGWTPVPIPSPAKLQPQPPPPRPPGTRPSIALHGASPNGSPLNPIAPANRHALHVWERDAYKGGLPPPHGYSAAPVTPRARPTAEQEKRAADLEHTQLTLRLKQLERENAQKTAALAKLQEQQRLQRDIERKKAALALEMDLMRAQIAVQELRQAGQPVPPELLAAVVQKTVAAPVLEAMPARLLPPPAAPSAVAPDAGARRAAALGRGPAAPAVAHADAAAESAPALRPTSAAAEMEWDDGGWPEPKDEEWGAAGDAEGSGSKRRREFSGIEAEDSRADRRARSHREQSGQRQRGDGVEEALVTAAAATDGAEAQQLEPHSRREKECRAHRSDKEERRHKSRHKSRRSERDPEQHRRSSRRET